MCQSDWGYPEVVLGQVLPTLGGYCEAAGYSYCHLAKGHDQMYSDFDLCFIQAEAELVRKGEMVEGEGFDSNCITPGTAFMGRLNDHLRFFIRKKIAEDPLWQKPAIILSGMSTRAP